MSSQPKVLFDATSAPVNRGGVGRYIDNLVSALDAQRTDLAVVCQSRDEALFRRIGPDCEIVALPDRLERYSLRLAWEQTGLPVLAHRLGVDVVHSPHYTIPLATTAATVVNLYDATFFTDRALHAGGNAGLKGQFLRSWTRIALRRATLCLVPSQASIEELVRVAGADRSKLVLAHLGADPSVFHPPDREAVAAVSARLGLGGRSWVAFLGTHEPRKNIPALIEGFVAATRNRPDPPALVLAGTSGWDQRIGPALAALPPGVTVIRAGYLPLELLAGFLGGALVVAYPSLGEGFGIPVLEAMACGSAVLTTRRLALPEVGGDAVAYSDTSAAGIGETLGRLLDHPEERAALGAAALKRAASFSWETSARIHREAYERAMASRRSRSSSPV